MQKWYHDTILPAEYGNEFLKLSCIFYHLSYKSLSCLYCLWYWALENDNIVRLVVQNRSALSILLLFSNISLTIYSLKHFNKLYALYIWTQNIYEVIWTSCELWNLFSLDRLSTGSTKNKDRTILAGSVTLKAEKYLRAQSKQLDRG